MMWKYLEQHVLFPKGLNRVQHWVRYFDLHGLDLVLGLVRRLDLFVSVFNNTRRQLGIHKGCLD